jgi:hypothetical protein
MFETFDFAVLESADFKEDAVREEIIAPMLKALGYSPSGECRVQRSATLAHPFVSIGTRRHNITIIPDYTLWHRERPLMIIDAKNPREEIFKSHHVEQAYSYAIHPDVRVNTYALCNGKRLVVFDVDKIEPVLDVASRDFDARWQDIVNYLSPGSLLEPVQRDFQPDMGIAVQKLGLSGEDTITFPSVRIGVTTRLSEGIYGTGASFRFPDAAGRPHLASFDFPSRMLEPILSCLAEPLANQMRAAFSRSPYSASPDYMLEVGFVTVLGTEEKDDYGNGFVPFIVVGLLHSKLNREPFEDDGELAKIPKYVFRLRPAFDALRQK